MFIRHVWECNFCFVIYSDILIFASVRRNLFIFFGAFLMLAVILHSCGNRKATQSDEAFAIPMKADLLMAITDHIENDSEKESYLYPDSVLCVGVWFDHRGVIDSLFILSGPMPIYDEEFTFTEEHFIGYLTGKNYLVSVASLGEDKPQLVSQFIDTTALLTDRKQYKLMSEAFTSHLEGLNVCAFLQSAYSINPDGELAFANRRVRR